MKERCLVAFSGFDLPLATSLGALFVLVLLIHASFCMAMTSAQASTKGTHLVVFVHGWMGNDRELGYLEETMKSQVGESHSIVFHSAKCNLGRTSDGVENGGRRLAAEVEEQIIQMEGSVLLSFVGNSLGGLYARHAIAHMDLDKVTPLVFCTTFTPHLGVSRNTYFPLPRWVEVIIGTMLHRTGQDLFNISPTVHEMGTHKHYLAPLRRFRKRLAIANAYGTDFQVPTATAAFLSWSSRYLHKQLPHKNPYLLTVETEPVEHEHDEQTDISQHLDSLGWTKIFLDVRDRIPLPFIPLPFGMSTALPARHVWESWELASFLTRLGRAWRPPFGHTVAVANSRDSFNRWFNAYGRPIMDQLAADLLSHMLHYDDIAKMCPRNETTTCTAA
jgi:hypothetical protein